MSDADLYFADTNLLLYCYDPEALAKRHRAEAWLEFLWRQRVGRVSWQVLNEFYANATKKMGLQAAAARDAVRMLSIWNPVDTSPGMVERAWGWMDKASVAYWDALIVSAAERIGAKYLLSEDFQDGRRFGDLVVVNPFRESPPGASLQ